MKILLVEDNPGDALLIRENLLEGFANSHIDISVVDRLSQAVKKLKETDFDVVLLDLGLPDSIGLETFLKLNKEKPGFPIIILTGLNDEETSLAAVRLGAQDYIVKGNMNSFNLHKSILYAYERNKAEKALQESEEKYRNLFNNDITANYVSTPSGKLLLCNKAYIDMFAYNSLEEAFEEDTHSLYLNREEREDFLNKLKKEKKLEQYEQQLVTRDGKVITVLENVVGTFNESDELIQFNGYIINITERKRAEEEIRELSERLQHIFASSPTIIYSMKVKGKAHTTTWISENVTRRLGYTVEEALSPNWWTKNINPDDLKKILPSYEKIFLVDKINCEYRFLMKDRTEVWIYEEERLIRDKEGNPTEIIGSLTDITERKQSEEKIWNLNRVYAVLSNINQAIVRIHDRDQLFNEVCRIAVEEGKFLMSWIGMLDSVTNKVKVYTTAGATNDYLDKIDIDLNDPKRSGGPTGRTLKTGIHNISNDIENDESMTPWIADALRLGYRSSASFPIKVFGKVYGCFNIYADEVGFFDKDEIKLLDELASDISFALEFIQNETERKRAEESLRESEKKYHAIFESTGTATLIVDEDTTILMSNNECLSLTGNTPAELFGQKWTQFVAPESLELMRKYHYLRRQDPALAPKKYEVKLVDKKGEIRDAILDIGMIPNTKNSIVSILDITERKQAEKSLMKSEMQLSNALDIAHLGPWEYDVIKDEFIFNDQFYKIFRLTAEQVGGYTMHSADYAKRFVHPDDMHLVGKETREAIETDDPNFSRVLEHRMFYGDGEMGYISVKFFIVKDSSGKTIKTYGVNQDITERKRAEEDIKKRVEELERFHRLTVGREMQMIELKQKINELSKQLGLEPPFPLDFLEK